MQKCRMLIWHKQQMHSQLIFCINFLLNSDVCLSALQNFYGGGSWWLFHIWSLFYALFVWYCIKSFKTPVCIMMHLFVCTIFNEFTSNGHVNCIPTIQLFTGISRITKSKSYFMLSLTECVWKFQKNATWDTHTCPFLSNNVT